MSWLDDTYLRNLDDAYVIEATCQRCAHSWLQTPVELLLKVDHRDVRLSEVAQNLMCTRFGCRHVGARLALIRNEDTSGFVGGMP